MFPKAQHLQSVHQNDQEGLQIQQIKSKIIKFLHNYN